MALLKDWNCEFKIESDTVLTVGQPFAILCDGTTPVADTVVPHFEFVKENQDYTLVLLRHKFKSPNELFLSATSWKTGSHDPYPIKLNLGSDQILISGPRLQVNSVLEKETKMNPPPPPMVAHIPVFLWYFLGLLFVFVFWRLVELYKYSKKYDRGMMKLYSLSPSKKHDPGKMKLSAFNSSLDPFYEFQKQSRLHKKSLESISTNEELKNSVLSYYKIFITYVSLTLEFPIFSFNQKELEKVFRKKNINFKLVKTYFSLVSELQKISEEISSDSELIVFKDDFEVLIQESIEFSQKLYSEKGEG